MKMFCIANFCFTVLMMTCVLLRILSVTQHTFRFPDWSSSW